MDPTFPIMNLDSVQSENNQKQRSVCIDNDASWLFFSSNLCSNLIFPSVFVRQCDRGFSTSPFGNLGQAREAATSQRNKVSYIEYMKSIILFLYV